MTFNARYGPEDMKVKELPLKRILWLLLSGLIFTSIRNNEPSRRLPTSLLAPLEREFGDPTRSQGLASL